jgi:DNA-directed RNA polymerase specialized sigma24 family protein
VKINPPSDVNDLANRLYTQCSSDQANAEPDEAGVLRFVPDHLLLPLFAVSLTEALNICDPSRDAEQELIDLRKRLLVTELLLSITAGERALVLSHFADGDSLAKIAAGVGVSKVAVYWRLRRILARLRVALDERGIGRLNDI